MEVYHGGSIGIVLYLPLISLAICPERLLSICCDLTKFTEGTARPIGNKIARGITNISFGGLSARDEFNPNSEVLGRCFGPVRKIERGKDHDGIGTEQWTKTQVLEPTP
jgi:hypothetical protein